MLIGMVIILVIGGMYFEKEIVERLPILCRYLQKYRLLSLAFSLMLSALLGMLFGAAGLIVFAAALVSTVLIQPWYVMRANGTWDRMRASYLSKKKEVIHRLEQLAKLIWILYRIASLPLIILFKVVDGIEAVTVRLTTERRQ